MVNRRITVEDVRAAFAKLGMKPIRYLWRGVGNYEDCCCGMGAMVMAAAGKIRLGFEEEAKALFGPRYSSGFHHGWDSGAIIWASGRWLQGYLDGQYAAQIILGRRHWEKPVTCPFPAKKEV